MALAPTWTPTILETVYSSIDSFGRYAYGNQPRIAQWNLARFAEALLPLLGGRCQCRSPPPRGDRGDFPSRFDPAFAAASGASSARFKPNRRQALLAKNLLDRMASNRADFTLTFRRLCERPTKEATPKGREWQTPFRRSRRFHGGLNGGGNAARPRVGGRPDEVAGMRPANPAFIPRNHLVEEAITAAQDHGDFGPFGILLRVLAAPYEDQPGFARYAEPPRPDQVVHQTFCGT